jgi:TPR repeat protein
MMRGGLVWLLLLVVAASAPAQSPDALDLGARLEAAKAIQRGDYPTAFKIYLPLAEKGDLTAMFWIATMYRRGQGVQRDIDRIVFWYTKVADGGYLGADFELAHVHEWRIAPRLCKRSRMVPKSR